MAVDGVVILVLAIDDAPVFHGAGAQDGAGNMDDGVDVGEADVQNSVAALNTQTIGDGVEGTDVLGGLQEDFLISAGQRSTTQSDGTIDGSNLGHGDAALGHETSTIGSGGPTTDDDLLVAASFTHHLAQQQRTEVIGDHVDDHAVFQSGDQLSKEELVANSGSADDDQLAALHALCDVVGDQIEVSSAAAIECETVGLHALDGQAGLVQILQGCVGEGRQVADVDLLASQDAVSADGLTDSTCTQDSNGIVFQIAQISHNKLLLPIK